MRSCFRACLYRLRRRRRPAAPRARRDREAGCGDAAGADGAVEGEVVDVDVAAIGDVAGVPDGDFKIDGGAAQAGEIGRVKFGVDGVVVTGGDGDIDGGGVIQRIGGIALGGVAGVVDAIGAGVDGVAASVVAVSRTPVADQTGQVGIARGGADAEADVAEGGDGLGRVGIAGGAGGTGQEGIRGVGDAGPAAAVGVGVGMAAVAWL